MPNLYKISNSRTNEMIADKALLADTVVSRAIGLLGRSGMRPGEALIIKPCDLVHMWFMRFAIDVVFLDGENRVISTQENLKPWRISRWVFGSKSVVELPAGRLADAPVQAGDLIEIRPATH